MQPLTSAAISASLSGVSTTNGYSTRQSVASVTCDTRDRPSNLRLSFAVTPAQHPAGRLAQVPHLAEMGREALHRRARRGQQLGHQRVALAVDRRRAAALHFVESVVQRVDQQLAPLRVVKQVVFEVGVALHHPDVAQHFVEHARRAPGAPLLAQQVEQFPGPRAQQPQHDLAVGKRGVVVGNLAQSRRFIRQPGSQGRRQDGFDGKRSVHGKKGRPGNEQSAPGRRSHGSYRSAAWSQGLPGCAGGVIPVAARGASMKETRLSSNSGTLPGLRNRHAAEKT